MAIYSYVVKRIEDGGWTGVPRFDKSLRLALPDLKSVTELPELKPDDIVITDNHLSLNVPDEIRTIVVHHGCAKTHYERDPEWRTGHTAGMLVAQKAMFEKPNREYVAPSWWVGREFGGVCPLGTDYSFRIIPHWVRRMDRVSNGGKPIIIGDWRDNNKGAGIWQNLAERFRQWEFKPLQFKTDGEKYAKYGEASLYLCLSLSEGGSYSVCDAEAAGLPIVTTDVGNYREFTDCEVIRWQDRDNLKIVGAVIEYKLAAGRVKPSYYESFTFDIWAEKWREVINGDSGARNEGVSQTGRQRSGSPPAMQI